MTLQLDGDTARQDVQDLFTCMRPGCTASEAGRNQALTHFHSPARCGRKHPSELGWLGIVRASPRPHIVPDHTDNRLCSLNQQIWSSDVESARDSVKSAEAEPRQPVLDLAEESRGQTCLACYVCESHIPVGADEANSFSEKSYVYGADCT